MVAFSASIVVSVEFLADVIDCLVKVMTLVIFLLGSILIHEILTKLGSSLVDADGVANYSGAASCGVRKLAALHPSCLKSWNRIDCIKQPKETDTTNWTRECFSKTLHELKHFVSLLLCGLGLFARWLVTIFLVFRNLLTTLPLSKCLPSELDHFFIAVRQESDVIEHLGQEACNICSPTETEHINLIAGVIKSHKESIASYDMLVE